ncbi:hypothetical protein HAX54_015346, partial [Datura stramonium]|nr:hypothetical protein [Datura stramonium]
MEKRGRGRRNRGGEEEVRRRRDLEGIPAAGRCFAGVYGGFRWCCCSSGGERRWGCGCLAFSGRRKARCCLEGVATAGVGGANEGEKREVRRRLVAGVKGKEKVRSE